jgi:septum formation protein
VATSVAELGEGDAVAAVLENARRKARAGLEVEPGARLVLGADTEVVLDGRLLGKAADAAGARAHLQALSGRTHTVLGGIVLLADGSERSALARTEVTFAEIGDELMRRYLDSGEWRDRAGAYAVQGLGAALVERIEGDLANVIGLPLRALLELAPELVS